MQTRFIVTGASLLLTGLALVGCRGERTDARPRQFLPDMDDSPKFRPQRGTEFFVDGRAMRPRVEQTVAFGTTTDPAGEGRERYLKDDEKFYFGTDGKLANGEPKFLDTIPFASIPGWPSEPKQQEEKFRSMIDRGHERFDIYCSACHGRKGDGKGEAGIRWSSAVANYHDEKFKDKKERTGKDGYIFYTARNGVWDRGSVRILDGKYRVAPDDTGPADKQGMPPYANSVNEADAWAIVAYIRVLQAMRVNFSEVPSKDQQERLRLKTPPPPPPPPPAPAAPAGTTPAAPPGTPATPVPTTPTPSDQKPATPADGGANNGASGGTKP